MAIDPDVAVFITDLQARLTVLEDRTPDAVDAVSKRAVKYIIHYEDGTVDTYNLNLVV